MQIEALILIKTVPTFTNVRAELKNTQFQRESTFNGLDGDAITGGFRPPSSRILGFRINYFGQKNINGQFESNR